MPITHPVNELITTATVAAINNVVPDTVRVWKRRGKIQPAFETPKGQCLYFRAEAERIKGERLQRKGGGQ